MQVTATKSLSFPKLQWGISVGDVRELPEGKAAQARILAEPEISEVRTTEAKKGDQLPK